MSFEIKCCPPLQKTYSFRQYTAWQNSTGLEAAIEAMEPKQRVGADAIVNVREENKHWRFYVEVKPHLTSHTLGAAILAVSQIKKEHHSAALVSAYINPSQAENCVELGIEFFDAAGNASFQQKGLHVFITGRKPQTTKTLGRPARAFNPTGSRLVFALLCQPGWRTNLIVRWLKKRHFSWRS